MKNDLTNYSNALKKLAKRRRVSPQNVYKSYTNRLQHKLVDFFCLNTGLLLKNLQELCPSIFKSMRNSSKSRTGVFIDKNVIKS